MYSLFMGSVGPSDSDNEIKVPASRFLEYTDPETQMRYRNLTPEIITEIKKYPALFMYEHCEGGAFVGRIIDINYDQLEYSITFEKNESIGIIESETIKDIALDIHIEKYEFYRTHWAIKTCHLMSVLKSNGILEQKEAASIEVDELPENRPAVEGEAFNKNQIFIVHGHDEHAKNDVKKYVESRGFEPIILHLQASKRRKNNNRKNRSL